MSKELQIYRWSHLRKLKELLNNDNCIVSPINAIKTVKIIELSNICEFIYFLKKQNNNNSLYEELKMLLRSNINLIINVSTICPGVNTTALNYMTLKLLSEELTKEEREKLSSNKNNLISSQRMLKK